MGYGFHVVRHTVESIRMRVAQPTLVIVHAVAQESPSESEKKVQEGGFSVLNEIRKNNELMDIFCTLVQIPSPSKKEEKVIEWIKNFAKNNQITCDSDNYGNLYLKVESTDSNKQPIMLSAHMDVVGDDSPIELILDGDFIKANDRTLGADDKVGVACALYLAKLLKSETKPHGGLEIIFTRDEETGMSGIENSELNRVQSKYVLVLDADKLGQLQISGAGYTNAKISVKALKGGHSGIDIGDKTRLNAVKLACELINNFPQGVFYEDETGVVTSCNIGAIVGGGIQNAVKTLVEQHADSKNFITDIIDRSSTNIINTLTEISYSIRSSDVTKEQELKDLMLDCINNFNEKYAGLACAEIEFSIHLLPFEKSGDDYIPQVHTQAAKEVGVKNSVESFHAGAETHIYAHSVNGNGEKFIPFLVGSADVYNMHSAEEKVDYKTILKGFELLKKFFEIYNA